jgi:hypothetical protein
MGCRAVQTFAWPKSDCVNEGRSGPAHGGPDQAAMGREPLFGEAIEAGFAPRDGWIL